MKLRNFDKADWETFAGAMGSPLIAEFGNAKNSYVVIVDCSGLTFTRYDDEGGSDFVTIDMLPSTAEALVGMMDQCPETIDQMIDDAQPQEL